MKILVTGGTVFVSRYTAKYFADKGNEVFVLNRGTKKQVDGVRLIKADRHSLNGALKGMHFDAVIDVCAYNDNDIKDLLSENFSFDKYILISSSAVYPETLPQPFKETYTTGANSIWKDYGTNKIKAEAILIKNVPDCYILRPPYLYGPMQNLYREGFVFDCALQNRAFYIPCDGKLSLQFYHVNDLCNLIQTIIKTSPSSHIINVGNQKTVSANEYAKLCYDIVGKHLNIKYITDGTFERNYFPFYNYSYTLDVNILKAIQSKTIPLETGLEQSYRWFTENKNKVIIKPYIQYIDTHFNYK